MIACQILKARNFGLHTLSRAARECYAGNNQTAILWEQNTEMYYGKASVNTKDHLAACKNNLSQLCIFLSLWRTRRLGQPTTGSCFAKPRCPVFLQSHSMKYIETLGMICSTIGRIRNTECAVSPTALIVETAVMAISKSFVTYYVTRHQCQRRRKKTLP